MNKRDTWMPNGCHHGNGGHGPGEHPDGGGGNNPPFVRCHLGENTAKAVTPMHGKHTRRRVSESSGSSCMRGNSHVQFRGGEGLVTARSYPVQKTSGQEMLFHD